MYLASRILELNVVVSAASPTKWHSEAGATGNRSLPVHLACAPISEAFRFSYIQHALWQFISQTQTVRSLPI